MMKSSGGSDKRPSQVLEHLFIGSRVHAKNRGLLKDLGINRILNVTPARTMDPTNGVPNFFDKDRSMTYKRVAVFDNRGEDLLQHVESCISFIEQGSFYGKVLVHCNKGVSRSSTVVAAYLMRTRGLSKTAAMTYLRSRRSIVNPHEGFIAQLEAFEVKLNGEREAAIADGQAKKFPDDLLDTAGRTGAAQGAAIGPIGPPRGPSAPIPSTKSASGNTSPTRRPVVGPSPPRSSTTGTKTGPTRTRGTSPSPPQAREGQIGPSRGPSPRPQVAASVVAAAGACVDGTGVGGSSSAGGAGGACHQETKSPIIASRSPSARREAGDENRVDATAAAAAAGSAAGETRKCKVPSKEQVESNGTPEAAEVVDTAAATANSPVSKSPASADAAIGPAIGPPAKPHVGPVASGTSSGGGGDGGNRRVGVEVEEGGGAEAGGGRSSSGSSGEAAEVGGKRAREGGTPTSLNETVVVQKARLATEGGDEGSLR